MSTASATNLQAAAQVVTAVATQLAAAPGAPMNAGSIAAILGTVAQAAGSTINPNIGLVLALASIGLNAIHAATTTGQGLTAEQWAQYKADDDSAIAEDAAAHPKV